MPGRAVEIAEWIFLGRLLGEEIALVFGHGCGFGAGEAHPPPGEPGEAKNETQSHRSGISSRPCSTPFSLPFVQRGLVEILILSVPAGLLGSWIVLRGLAFFSHAVGTATFPGLVLAAGLGFAAQLGAFGAALAFAALTVVLRRGRTEGEDGVTALALVGCLALGVILASDVFHSGSQIETLLFGSLLLIDSRDILLAALAAGAVVVASALIGHRWLAVGFDPAAARGLGSPPTA